MTCVCPPWATQACESRTVEGQIMRSVQARANFKKLPSAASRHAAVSRAAMMEALEVRQLMSLTPVLGRVDVEAPRAALTAAPAATAAVSGTTVYDSQGFEPSK